MVERETDMSLELDIIELYNPLYLLPIVGVVFCALLVYAFGFKSAAQPPNFAQLSTKKVIPVNVIKKRKLTTTKAQQNGSVVSDTKIAEKKITPKKVDDKPIAAKKVNNQVKKSRKSVKNEDQSVDIVEVEDRDAGEWVELISRKERKNRKQKEEQLLKESNDTLLDSNANIKTAGSPKKRKKGKENKDKNEQSVKEVKDNRSVLDNLISNTNTVEDKTRKDENEDLIVEDPDIYELVKEQRVPKKSQKYNRLNKRIVDSEVSLKLETESDAVISTDKLTASIMANYESVDQSKPDSLSTANNKKKKDKNKRKQPQSNDSQANKAEIKNGVPISVAVEAPTDKSIISINSDDDVKQLDDDFKLTTGRKRRARRE